MTAPSKPTEAAMRAAKKVCGVHTYIARADIIDRETQLKELEAVVAAARIICCNKDAGALAVWHGPLIKALSALDKAKGAK